MKDFSILDSYPTGWQGWVRYDIGDEFPVPGILKVTFSLSACVRQLDYSEKTQWAFSFQFQNRPSVVAFQKFGLRLYIQPEFPSFTNRPSSSDKTDLGNSLDFQYKDGLLQVLKKSVRLVENGILKSVGVASLKSRDLIIRNDYRAIHEMYEYFRFASTQLSKDVDRQEDMQRLPEGDHTAGEVIKAALAPWFALRERERERGYNDVASVLSFFSLLEHVLVLLLPLSQNNISVDIDTFIGLPLTDKWTAIFSNASPIDSRMREKVFQIADKYRNFYSHGGVSKRGKSAYFTVPTIGSIPMSLSKVKNDVYFPFLEIASGSNLVEIEVFPFFDELELWLKQGSSSFAMRFIEEGFDVPFSKKFVETFLEVTRSEEEFEDWMQTRSEVLDRFHNFES